jgi:hypothetical protein
MLASIDLWLGKHVFVPPLVMLRKMAGWDKRASIIFLFILWTLISITNMAIMFTPISILMGVISCVIAATYIPFVQQTDAALVPREDIRRILIVINAACLPVAILFEAIEGYIPVLLLLACEYAKTIDTLPPDRKTAPSTRHQNA